jgi:hypothetical protein
MRMLKLTPTHTENPAPTPEWKYASSIYLPRHHCVIFRDEEMGLQKQVMTRRNTFLFPPRERNFYFIDGDRRTFRSEEHLLKALLRLRNRRNGHRRR